MYSIGMITDPLVVSNGLRGETAIRTVTVFNAGNEVSVYSLQQEGDVEGWITFFDPESSEKIEEISVPSKSYKDILARVEIPKDAPNGSYTGEISISEKPGDPGEKGTATITKMITRKVNIEVTDKEIKEIEATFIPEKYDLPLGEPLKVRVIYKNTGNVSLAPDLQVRIIKDDESVVFNAIFPYLEDGERISPGETKEIDPFLWQTAGEERGKYRAEMIVLSDTEPLKENHFNFNVGNVLHNPFFAAIALLGGGNFITGLLIVIAFSALIYSLALRSNFSFERYWELTARKIKSLF